MEPRLRRQIERVDERTVSLRRERASALTWTLFAAAGVLLFFVRGGLDAPALLVTLALLGLAGVAVFAVRALVSRAQPDPRVTARRIEAAHPELESALLAAVELEPDLPNGEYGFLSRRLVDQVLHQSREHGWADVVPRARLDGARWMHTTAAVACVAAAVLLWFGLRPALPGAFGGELGGGEEVAVIAPDQVLVLPGDAEVERGRSVLVSAEFSPERVPGEATLVLRAMDASERRVELTRSLDDPLFGARLASVEAALDYRVEWSDKASAWFRLDVFEHPALVRSDFELRFPEYAGMDARRVEDARRVTVPRGTQITLIGTFNKADVRATLVELASEAQHELAPESVKPLEQRVQLAPEESTRYRLELEDGAGRRQKARIELVVEVTDNLPPELRLASARDVRVSPLEELSLSAELSDDFGLLRHGLGYQLVGADAVELELGSGGDAPRAAQAEHTIAFEALAAQPDQLLTYHFWAEDLGPDGETRRTTSDLFFAEVRPFEEIFREGEAQPGGSQSQGEQQGEQPGAGDAAQQAGELAELQRDVILATWKLLRGELSRYDDWTGDARVVRDAQQAAIDQLGELAGAGPLPGGEESAASLQNAEEAMERALDSLERAAAEAASAPLEDALMEEQLAYQALLELRAHEFEVQRQDSQSQSPSSSSRANAQGGPTQQQLNQLELSNDENRYETQSQARAESRLQEDEVARDTRAALDRLKELARRQADLNERLRELTAELQAAESEEEEAELRRRLERLQDAQEEILRDTDELRQELDGSQASEQLAEERQQLDQTRENVRRASEALEEGRLSQALAEGSRAESELGELEDALRDAAGGQFDERMRDMQEEARRVEEEQERLAEQLRELNEEAQRSLREDGAQEALERGLERQQEDLAELLRELEETVLDAERAEPLLAEELFETLGEARENAPEVALDQAREMIRRGFPGSAEEAEREAREGIGALREGVERAAREVLGTGAEALERAERELEQLAEELEAELERARGEAAGQSPSAREGQPPGEAGEQPGSQQPGQQPGEQPGEQPGGQPGGQQPGEQPGGQQPGDQPGQPGDQPGQPGDQPGQGQGQEPGQGEQPGQQPGGGEGELRDPGGGQAGGGRRGGRPSLTEPAPRTTDERGGGQGSPGEYAPAPLTGDDYVDWSDRLRDVEEMIDDPELAAEAARLRGRARAVREDFKRHSREPDWELVDEKLARPLTDLRLRVAEEARRRRADDADVPIDRDPVPPEFEEEVRRYYERLGGGD